MKPVRLTMQAFGSYGKKTVRLRVTREQERRRSLTQWFLQFTDRQVL